MAQISQRRDLDDKMVIENFARLIQSPENLVMLTLHTFADSMGTSDQLWNGFKDAVLWQLYRKTRQALTGDTEFLVVEARQRELLVEEVQRMAPPTLTRPKSRPISTTCPRVTARSMTPSKSWAMSRRSIASSNCSCPKRKTMPWCPSSPGTTSGTAATPPSSFAPGTASGSSPTSPAASPPPASTSSARKS
jgi:hypothetical protein